MSEIKLTYEERQAFPIIRKALKRNPELAAKLFEGMAKEGAVGILLQAKKELADLHALSKAMSEAAYTLAKMEKQNENI